MKGSKGPRVQGVKGERPNRLSGCLPFPDQKNNYAGRKHEAAEQLAHGHAGRNKAEMGVRLPEKFNPDPENSIKNEKKCNHGA